MEKTTTPPAIEYTPPTGQGAPFVFAAPHSGRHYPADMTTRSPLTENQLRLSEDAFVDELFDQVPKHGAHFLKATYARAYVDLNRAENELDSTMFSPPLNPDTLKKSYRVDAGLGVIPKLVAEGVAIYDSALPAREAIKRLTDIYQPYHQKLAALLETLKNQHQTVYLIDCHSMPSSSAGKGSGRWRTSKSGPDIVLGDCWGSSCAREFTSHVESLLYKAGFSVKRNIPYSGGYSTSHYGKPVHSVEALQIEINRALYMQEDTLTPLPEFDEIKATITKVCLDLMQETLLREKTMAKMQQHLAAE